MEKGTERDTWCCKEDRSDWVSRKARRQDRQQIKDGNHERV